MIKMLFVCHGNICRSVAAEFICKQLIKEQKLENEFYIDSCATSLEEIGNPIYPPMKKVLEKHHILLGKHYARQITKEDYNNFDYIFIMDNNNMRNIKHLLGEDINHKIYLIKDFVGKNGYIEDPWYTGNYELVFNDLYDCIQRIIEKLRCE